MACELVGVLEGRRYAAAIVIFMHRRHQGTRREQDYQPPPWMLAKPNKQ